MSLQAVDAIDKELLNLLQEGFEFVPQPFAIFAEKLGIS
jgi:DNA-binding Lrp family transcriptional regulator